MKDFLYPKRKNHAAGFFRTKDGHKLYYERYGNPEASEKVVYLHGGPGAGCAFDEYRYFDPKHYDVLIFDQRWSGKSRPIAGEGHNSIKAAIADLEGLRKHFGFKKWHIAGGSWGSALALLYTVRHPQKVKSLLLRGVFFGDKKGARYIIEKDGAAAKSKGPWFEEYWRFVGKKFLLHPYYQMLTQGGKKAQEAARLFIRWDTAIATAKPDKALIEAVDRDPFRNMALSRTFFHFSVHEFKDKHKSEILKSIKNLDIPIHIVHGSHDHICPVKNAVLLNKYCRDGHLQVIKNGGHTMRDPAIQRAFIKAADKVAGL